jgi:hypothetical protein
VEYNLTLPPPPYHFLRPKDPADQKRWYWRMISISGSVALALYACMMLPLTTRYHYADAYQYHITQ